MMKDNRDLFWELVEPEHLKARAFCRKLCKNREDGDDLYQDALVAGLVNLSSLKEKELFKAWFYKIIVNRFKNRIRRPWWQKFVPITAQISEKVNGDNPTVKYEARAKLKTAFSAIKPEEKALITLFEIEGWSITELSRMFGVSETNTKVKLCRIRKKMRQAILKKSLINNRRTSVKPLKSEAKICVAAKQGKD